MNNYELSRNWFDWCFENPDLISPNHSALYFFIIEHCNRLGWKEKFGLPTTMVKDAIGIKSYNTYIKTLNDLIDFGFIKLIEKSKNQYSSNIIALSKINKATTKALDKALIKHVIKQSESIEQSIDSINKQITIEQDINIPSSIPSPPIIETPPPHKLQIAIKEKLPAVSKMRDQLTFDQCEKLINDFGAELVWDKLQSMENFRDLKKYNSVNLTVRNWCKRK